MPHNHFQAAGNLKFQQKPKTFKLTKTLNENVETTVSGVGAAETSSTLKSKGNKNNYTLVINWEKNSAFKDSFRLSSLKI